MTSPSSDSKLTFWLITLCLTIGVHINFENTGGTGLELPYNSIAWIFTGLIFFAGLKHISKSSTWHHDQSITLVGLTMLTLVLPVIFQESLEPSMAGTRILGILTGLLLVILFYQSFQSGSTWQRLLIVIAVAGSLESILCLIQQYLPEIAAYGVYKPDYGRPFGSFQQPNVSASFIVTGLAASLYLQLNHSSSHQLTRRHEKLFIQSTPLLAGIAIPLLGSRVGMLGSSLVFAFCLPLIVQQLKEKSTRPQLMIWLSYALLGITIALSSLQFMNSGGRNIESLQSTANREGIYQQAFDMIQQKPLSGWGYGQFEARFIEYYADQVQHGNYQHKIVANLDHPHNELLLWAIEGGIIPALLLVSLALYLCYRIIRRLGLTQGLAALSLSMPLALHANTEYPFYQSFAHWLLFCLIICWLIWKSATTTHTNFKWSFFTRCFAWIIPCLVIPIMLLNLQAIYKVTQYHASGKASINHLADVIHPSGIWKRFFFDVNTYRLTKAIQEKNRSEIEAYTTWAESFLEHTPREVIFFNLTNAYWTLNEKAKALDTLKRLAYLYPDSQAAKDSIIRAEQMIKTFNERHPN